VFGREPGRIGLHAGGNTEKPKAQGAVEGRSGNLPIHPPGPHTAHSDGVNPLPVLANEINETFDGFDFGDVELDRPFADIKIDLAGRAADIAEIGIGHFAGAVHDATHDRDLHAFQMGRAFFDPGGDGLEIEQGSSAGRAGDVVGLETPATSRLEDIVSKSERLSRTGFATDQDGVADPIRQQ